MVMSDERPPLPRNFRKLSIEEKRETLRYVLGVTDEEAAYLAAEPVILELADAIDRKSVV